MRSKIHPTTEKTLVEATGSPIMKTITYPDGSESFLFEPGDQVILRDYPKNWIAKSGDPATVIRPDEISHPLIDFLQVQTYSMKAGGWGILTVPPWQLAPFATAVSTLRPGEG